MATTFASSSVTPGETLPRGYEVGTVLYISIVCICIIFGTVGNVLVLVSVGVFSRLRIWANAFIVNLAVADLIITSFTLPTVMIRYLEEDFMKTHHELCKLVFQLNFTVVVVSISTLGVSSISRYILITKPRYIYQQHCGRNNIVLLLVIIWCVSICAVFIPTLSFDLITYVPANQFCHFKEDSHAAWWYGTAVLLIFVGLVMAIIIIFSIMTFRKITAARNRVEMVIERSQTNSQDVPPPGRQGLTKQEIIVTKMMLLVCLGFCLSMLPYCINHALSFHTYKYPQFIKICIFLILFNSCINPLIYAGSNRFFRTSFKKILTCKWRGNS